MQFTPNGIRFSVPLSDQIKTRLTKIEAALFSEGIRNAEDLANHPELSRLLVRLIDACSQRQDEHTLLGQVEASLGLQSAASSPGWIGGLFKFFAKPFGGAGHEQAPPSPAKPPPPAQPVLESPLPHAEPPSEPFAHAMPATRADDSHEVGYSPSLPPPQPASPVAGISEPSSVEPPKPVRTVGKASPVLLRVTQGSGALACAQSDEAFEADDPKQGETPRDGDTDQAIEPAAVTTPTGAGDRPHTAKQDATLHDDTAPSPRTAEPCAPRSPVSPPLACAPAGGGVNAPIDIVAPVAPVTTVAASAATDVDVSTPTAPLCPVEEAPISPPATPDASPDPTAADAAAAPAPSPPSPEVPVAAAASQPPSIPTHQEGPPSPAPEPAPAPVPAPDEVFAPEAASEPLSDRPALPATTTGPATPKDALVATAFPTTIIDTPTAGAAEEAPASGASTDAQAEARVLAPAPGTDALAINGPGPSADAAAEGALTEGARPAVSSAQGSIDARADSPVRAATSPVPAPATAAARPPVAAPDDEISLSSFYSGPSPPPAPRARPATAGDAPSSAGPLEAKGHDALDSPPPAHLGVGSRAASTVSPRSVTSSARAVAAASTPPRAEDSASGTAGPAAFSGGAPSADDGAGVVLKTPGHPEFDVVSWLDSLGLRCYAAQFVSSCCVTPLSVATLTDADLRELGVSVLGHRRHIMGAAQLLVGAPAPSPLSADLPEAWVRRLTNIHPTSAGFEVAVSPPEPLQAGLGAPGEDDTSPND